MIYLLTTGDGYNGTYGVEAVLEGPDLTEPLEEIWAHFLAEFEAPLNAPPPGSANADTMPQWNAYWKRRTAALRALCNQYGVSYSMSQDQHNLTQCFLMYLEKEYQLRDADHQCCHTED